MSVINTNVKSLVAQNSMTVNGRAMSKAMEQLSTGKRINTAADDAAGLAISSKMTAQIKGLDQAVRNANDGITLLQTAEGATIEMTNMLQRMRELAIQSANDTNTTDDRSSLDLEYQQLTKEITRIASNTQWNGMSILKNAEVGTAGGAGDVGVGARNVKFQVGANADQVINIGLKDFSFGTGTPAVASESQLNLMGNDLKDAKNFSIKVGGTAFSVVATAAVTDETSASAVTAATDLQTKFQNAISNTVGFENVTVTRVGSTLSIEDSQGRTISDFAATKADATAVVSAAVQTVLTAGTVAAGAVDPAIANANAVFSGNARLNDTNITTQAKANEAVGRLDNALKAVNTERATMGATINRLTYAADNLTNVSQNASESRSRIQDTDYASATTELARTQIISQAATAMLAQANQAPQSVLSLLR
jgi:flagellin